MNKVTNKKFAEENENFLLSVDEAEAKGHKIEATKRQASKFRNKKGIAYRYSRSLPKKKRTEGVNEKRF